MADGPQPAARVTDQVRHTQAMSWRRGLGIFGAVVGVAVGAVLVAGVEVATAGLATPFLVGAVVVGEGLIMGGSVAVGAGAFSNVGADIGSKIPGSDEGPIISGVQTILIGTDRQFAAHLGSNVACRRHKHSGAAPMPDVTNPNVEQVSQGSGTVRVGSGKWPMARVGAGGTCGFRVGHGWSNVLIGGPTVGQMGAGDDPEKGFFDKLTKYGGWAVLAGVALVEAPAGIAVMLWTGGSAFVISQGIGHLINTLPPGLPRDSVTALATMLPLVKLGGVRTPDEVVTGPVKGAIQRGVEGKPWPWGPYRETPPEESAAPAPAGEDAAPAPAEPGTPGTQEPPAAPAPAAEEAPPAASAPEETVPPEPLPPSEPAQPEPDPAPAAEPKPAGDDGDFIYRKDNAAYSSEGRSPGQLKSHLDAEGNLRPANPDGQATLQDHVAGWQPKKSDSPYTSFSDTLNGTEKNYGDQTIVVDKGALQQDIASGKVQGVEVVDHDALMSQHQQAVDDAQAAYEGSPTRANRNALNQAQRNLQNSARDNEVLIKGTIPKEYIQTAPPRPGGSEGPVAPEGGTPPGDGAPPAGSGGTDDEPGVGFAAPPPPPEPLSPPLPPTEPSQAAPDPAPAADPAPLEEAPSSETAEEAAGEAGGTGLKPNGEFEDPAQEAAYQRYVARNTRTGRAIRDRGDWKTASDAWKNSPAARGNDFNRVAGTRDYDYNEVHLANGKRLDSYRPPDGATPGEIVSRKAIDFDSYSDSDFRAHLNELNAKYPAGTTIRSDKYPELDGQTLSGQPYLEVPDTNVGSANQGRFEDMANDQGILIRYAPEH